MYIFFYFFLGLNLIIGQNSYPIVLIHGFMGWGSDEMGGYNYWGGEKDFIYLLEKNGHTVFELSVGPISSNWERAIECYYQIKGGAVDYGQAHSEMYNIIRKPKTKTYNGLYPEWSSKKPIHIVAHSMGGQTARMLNYLLTQEFYIDEENKLKEESRLLGGIQNNMIKSITTISTPHDGTTLTGIVTKTIPFIQYFVGVAGVIGTQFYDFDLEQFSFLRKKEESWQNYLKRMRNHEAWKTKNISSWDLGLDGAKELNNYLQASPDIYYFSFVTSTTRKSKNTKKHTPVKGTSILIKTRSKLLGSLSGYWSDGTKTDSSWYENDGIVNTISMFGPSTGINGPDPIVKYEKLDLLIPGQWYWIFLSEMDHWSVIGHLGDSKRTFRAEKYFIEHASRLKMLPQY
tara:strand:- start:11915 stop:13117 length:1203 start_codon:yes stop_codon:yes gene_type:complete